LVLERGQGIFVYDSNAGRISRACPGCGGHALGYGNEELAEAAAAQMRKLSFAHLFSGKSHDPAIELAEKLKEIAPVRPSKVFFLQFRLGRRTTPRSSWSVFNHEKNAPFGRPQKKKIISRLKGYHGVTIASASLTGCRRTSAISICPSPASCMPACPHHYRFAEPARAGGFATRLAAELRANDRAGRARHRGAFIAEPGWGRAGCWCRRAPISRRSWRSAAATYLHDRRRGDLRLRPLGTQFGSQSLGFRPDGISVAKALTSGYVRWRP